MGVNLIFRVTMTQKSIMSHSRRLLNKSHCMIERLVTSFFVSFDNQMRSDYHSFVT